MTFASLSEAEQIFIEKKLLKPAHMAYRLGEILSAEGVFEPTDKAWMGEWAGFKWDAQNLGRISFGSYENAGDVSPSYSNKTGSGFALSGILTLSEDELEAARNNIYGVEKGLAEMVDMQLADFKRQIEGIIGCGDTSRYQLVGDPAGKSTGSTVYNGILNGTDGTHLTVVAAGIDDDNNVTVNGDFYDTMCTMESAMDAEGIDTSVVHIIMDQATWQVLRKSRATTAQRYEIQDITESFPKWSFDHEDHILEYGATATHRIYGIQPRDMEGQKNLKYKISKELHIRPVNGGNINANGKYQWLLGWKGGPLILNEHCVMKSGALTIA